MWRLETLNVEVHLIIIFQLKSWFHWIWIFKKFCYHNERPMRTRSSVCLFSVFTILIRSNVFKKNRRKSFNQIIHLFCTIPLMMLIMENLPKQHENWNTFYFRISNHSSVIYDLFFFWICLLWCFDKVSFFVWIQQLNICSRYLIAVFFLNEFFPTTTNIRRNC